MLVGEWEVEKGKEKNSIKSILSSMCFRDPLGSLRHSVKQTLNSCPLPRSEGVKYLSTYLPSIID